MSKKGLGSGLSHLIEQNMSANNQREVFDVSVGKIKPNPYQPRKTFDQKALEELSKSIKENGLFQPILLRETLVGYEIISGERRYRASKLAGLKTIPAIIYDYTDQQMMEVALVENIQREDLSIVEEARSYQSLIDNLGYTQEQLANKVGKSRSHVANIIRLLKLDDDILESVDKGLLSMGHVKVLITIDDKKHQHQIVDQIISQNLNVRQTEELANSAKGKSTIKVKQRRANETVKSARNKRIETIVREKLGVQVIVTGEKKGSIEFKYNSPDELENLLEQLNLV